MHAVLGGMQTRLTRFTDNLMFNLCGLLFMHAVLGGMQTRLTRFTDNLMFNLCGVLFMHAVLGVMKIRLTGATKGHALLKKKADALTLKFRFVAVSAFYPAIGMESAASRSVALNFQHLLLFKKADVLQQRI